MHYIIPSGSNGGLQRPPRDSILRGSVGRPLVFGLQCTRGGDTPSWALEPPPHISCLSSICLPFTQLNGLPQGF